MRDNDHVIIWEAPKIVPPEFRLYYDEQGKVITYTCEKLEGNYIVIDASTFIQARPDVRVVDGKVVQVHSVSIVSKLMPADIEGTECAEEDLSIIPEISYTGKKQKWSLNVHTL